jgi:multidrug efflux pump
MTSIAFCAGVLLLIFGSGAGSEMRRAMGIAVFSGMLGVTFFGIFLTPVFYVLLRTRRARRLAAAPPGADAPALALGADGSAAVQAARPQARKDRDA